MKIARSKYSCFVLFSFPISYQPLQTQDSPCPHCEDPKIIAPALSAQAAFQAWGGGPATAFKVANTWHYAVKLALRPYANGDRGCVCPRFENVQIKFAKRATKL